MTAKEINKLPVFFIVAAARSGTTLLRTILDAHPNVSIPPESKLIIHLKSKYNNSQNWNDERVKGFISDLLFDKKVMNHWQIDPEKLYNELLEIPEPQRSFTLFCKIIYLHQPSIFPKKEAVIIGDKNPVYSIFIEELLEIFPSAKFIHLIRDPRDVIVSNRKNFARNNVAVFSQYWKTYNRQINWVKKKYPQQFYTIRYEDLVNEPEKNIREISNFLAIEYDPKSLLFYKTIEEYYDPEKHVVLKNMFPGLLKPISNSSIGKWIGKLKEVDLAIIDFISSDVASKYGYHINDTTTQSKFYFLSFKGFWVQMMDRAVIKLYYLIPFTFRKMIRLTADYLFNRFNYYTSYNEDDKLQELLSKKESETKQE